MANDEMGNYDEAIVPKLNVNQDECDYESIATKAQRELEVFLD